MLFPLDDMDLAKLYRENGHRLYLIGGSSRDVLLGLEPDDYDYATDATPEEEKAFIEEGDFTFARFGTVRIKRKGKTIDVTTFRQEGAYDDSRHPSGVNFVREPSIDYRRRDFTINAIYINDDDEVLDFGGGLNDLKTKTIRFIGNPYERIKEDPLRIVRAERLRDKLGFSFEEETGKAIMELRPLLAKLNPQKLAEEKRKGWKG